MESQNFSHVFAAHAIADSIHNVIVEAEVLETPVVGFGGVVVLNLTP